MDDSKLSIAILSVHSCPAGHLGARDTGGMSVYIREVARALSEQGHGVDIYTQLHNPEDACVTTLGRDTRLIHLEAGQDRRVPKLALYASLPEFAANLENYRVEHHRRYDLVFSHYWLSGWVGESLRAWWQVPHLMVFHTLGAIKNAIGIGETEPEIRLETERRLARSCPRLIATTEREKTALVGHYGALPERVGVVPCGVNLDLFRPGDARAARQRLGLGEEKLILYVGRIEPLKGLDRLIEAMACLPGEPPRLVVIGGDDSSQPEIARLKA
ncbi:MAG: glycosyltransferase, partial [Chloroflexota bacterium]